MKKLIGFAALAGMVLVGARILQQNRPNWLMSPSDKLSLRDALSDTPLEEQANPVVESFKDKLHLSGRDDAQPVSSPNDGLPVNGQPTGPQTPLSPFIWFPPYRSPEASQLLEQAWAAQKNSQYVEAESQARRAVAAARRSGDQAAIESALAYWVKLQWELGRYDECEQQASALASLLKKAHPQGSAMTGYVLRELAYAYLGQARYKEAEAACREALAIQDRILPADDPEKAETYYVLGCALVEQSKLAQAASAFNKALDLARSRAQYREVIALAYYGLGAVYMFEGRHTKAESLYKTALAMADKIWGNQHLQTAPPLNALGWAKAKLGEYEKAVTAQETARDIVEKSIGADSPRTASYMSDLGEKYRLSAKREESLKIQEKALSIKQAHLKAGHSSLAYSYDCLGRIHKDMGKPKEAQDNFEKALAIYDNYSNHPNFAETLLEAGLFYAAIGQNAKAAQLLNKALSLFTAMGNQPEATRARNAYYESRNKVGRTP